MSIAEYKKYFFDEIRNNKDAVFHNGDIYPPNFKKINAVTWYNTDEDLTNKERLIPRDQKYDIEKFWILHCPHFLNKNSLLN